MAQYWTTPRPVLMSEGRSPGHLPKQSPFRQIRKSEIHERRVAWQLSS